MTKKKYRDVYVVEDSLIYMQGDWTAQEFVEACKAWDDGYIVRLIDVHHCYARSVPFWEGGEYQYNYIDLYRAKDRGAFLITFAEEFVDLGDPD